MSTRSDHATDYTYKISLPYTLDKSIGRQASVGLVALASDRTIEQEWRRLLPLDELAFFVNRIHNFPQVTLENLKRMEIDLAHAASLILPGVTLDVLAYGCTSATMLIGEAMVADLLRSGKPEVKQITTPITAAKAAFDSLGIRRIALLTPYIQEINQTMRAYLEQAGIRVPVMGSFNNEDDNEVMLISLDSIQAAALELGQTNTVDAVFIACTSLRGATLIESLETQLGKPVTTSCHALAWHTLRLAGYAEPIAGQGILFRL